MDGWLVSVDFIATSRSFRPKDQFNYIKPMLAAKYAPLNKAGEGNQGAYLSQISQSLANYLLNNTGDANVRSQVLSEAITASAQIKEASELERLNTDPGISPTEREQISKARVGQGQFRRAVSEIGHSCRVTGLKEPQHLRASHIKPWRDSSNRERLDGNNGLMLAVHIDHLFDKGFITFSDDGKLILSSQLSQEARQSFNLLAVARPGEHFSPEQSMFLTYHRQVIFAP